MAQELYQERVLDKVGCPKCGQPTGSPCKYPNGRLTEGPHYRRVMLARAIRDVIVTEPKIYLTLTKEEANDLFSILVNTDYTKHISVDTTLGQIARQLEDRQ